MNLGRGTLQRLFLSGALMLAGCSPAASEPKIWQPPAAPATSPVTVDDNPPRWMEHNGDLQFVPADSDAYGMIIRCMGRRGFEVRISQFEGGRTGAMLTSGAYGRRYDVRAEEDELGWSTVSRLDRDDPVMRAFASTGAITVDGDRRMAASTDPEREAVSRFFTRCGGR